MAVDNTQPEGIGMEKMEIKKGIWPKRPEEIYYWFDWDWDGMLKAVSEDEAMTVGGNSYCRILFNCSDFKYRIFVPKTAGEALNVTLTRKMTAWLKDRWGMETEQRLMNLNVTDRGEYFDGRTMKPKELYIPENIGGVDNETPS